MKVKDIMVKNVICATPKTKIRKVAKILIDNKIHGVPIVKNKRVVGIITETDFFVKGENSLYIPSFIEFMKKSKIFRAVSIKKKLELRSILKATAKDIMSSPCITVNPETDLSTLLNLFRKKNLHTIPVVDNNGFICGIITLVDIISLVKI